MLAAVRGKMKIVEIEEHEVVPPFHDYNAETLFRYHGLSLQTRVIYVVRTDVGLGGLRRERRPAEEGSLQGLPWHRSVRLDGGHQEPAHEHGRLRPHGEISGSCPPGSSWDPRCAPGFRWAAWTVSRPPKEMAEEVLDVSRRGYHWLKYHVDVLQNAIDQTEAMQKVAPPGFKIHYDFNEDSNFEAVYPVLRELEKFRSPDGSKTPSVPKIATAIVCCGRSAPSPSSFTTALTTSS